MTIIQHTMLANLLLHNAFSNAGSLCNTYLFLFNYFALDVCNIIIYIMVFAIRCLRVIDAYFQALRRIIHSAL